MMVASKHGCQKVSGIRTHWVRFGRDWRSKVNRRDENLPEREVFQLQPESNR